MNTSYQESLKNTGLSWICHFAFKLEQVTAPLLFIQMREAEILNALWGFINIHLFTYLAMKSESETRSVVSNFLQPHGLYSPWNSPGQNTGVGTLSLIQAIYPNQVSRIAGRFFTSWATREAQL